MENPARDPVIKAWLIMHTHQGVKLRVLREPSYCYFLTFQCLTFNPLSALLMPFLGVQCYTETWARFPSPVPAAGRLF